MVGRRMNLANQFTILSDGYDAAGNVITDGVMPEGLSSGCNASDWAFPWNAEKQTNCRAGVSYLCDGAIDRGLPPARVAVQDRVSLPQVVRQSAVTRDGYGRI